MLDVFAALDALEQNGVRLHPDDVARRDGLIAFIGALWDAADQSAALPAPLMRELDRLVVDLDRQGANMISAQRSLARLRDLALSSAS